MKNESIQQTMKAREHDVSDVSKEVSYKSIQQGVVDTYKKIENGVVRGYKKIESGAVEGFGKVTDKCVEVLFARDGESVQEAKDRLSRKNEENENE